MRILAVQSLTLSNLVFLLVVLTAGCDSPAPSADNSPRGTTTAVTGEPASAQTQDESADDNSQALKLMHWNIESGGNDPNLIASQLSDFAAENQYSVFALSEVHHHKIYEEAFSKLGESDQWQSVLGESGQINRRESDRLMVIFDSTRLRMLSTRELNEYGEFKLNKGRHRSPLLIHFEDRISRNQFYLIQNHLARGDAEFRAEQAKGLREFGRDNDVAKLCVGDFNFDFVFETRTGNAGFVEMVRDDVWKWIEPAKLIDTNWYDPDMDGQDNFPGSMLDFTFVAGQARDWNVVSSVIVRQGDFPDNQRTSDHRPVEVVIPF